MTMKDDQVDLSEGWELGWCEEKSLLNKWMPRFAFWGIEEEKLVGEGERAQIIANVEPEDEYSWESVVGLDSEKGEFSVIFKYYLERFSYYQVRFQPGSKIQVNYILSGGFDSTLLKDVGPVVEIGKEYSVQVIVQGETVEIRIDGERIGNFKLTFPFGSYPGFQVNGYGRAHFRDARLLDLKSGNTLFEDDFHENSLIRKVPVDISELACKEWIPAEIPGSVHSSLLKAGKIEDPYIGYNGPKQKWIDRQRWIYKKKFRIPEAFRDKNLKILFEGFDYHGYVWLNGKLLGYHEGMFGGPEYDITSQVNLEGENEVLVCLLPCPHPFESNVKPYIFQRWHFNMDILTIGLWRPVRLLAYDNLILHSPQVITRSIEKERAVLDVNVCLTSFAMYPFNIKGKFILTPPSPEDEIIEVDFDPGFFNGTLKYERQIEIPHPRLWWPNGMGEQPLYRLTIRADVFEHHKSEQATGQDEISLTFGVRTLEKRPTPDKRGKYNWVLCINGRPFFGKGSNWMPIDQMLRLPKDHYNRLLQLAKESHINILRPWGAGLLETDEFYDLCDQYGICVWQECLLANGYFQKIDREVWRDTFTRTILRLRNRPSLVVWCGGNEFDPDCNENKLIVDDLENRCSDLDPTRDFHRACPHGGDSHSYQVNWMEGGCYPYFTRDLSTAITEFSMASPSSLESLKKVIPEEEFEKWPPYITDNLSAFALEGWSEESRYRESAFSLHDAHLTGALKIMMPFLSDCGVPSNWEEFIVYCQTAQGILTQFGIDFWRSRWPYCTMAMSWVFDVSWPSSFTWEYVDWFGVPKISYYHQKRAYEPLHAGAVFDELFWRAGSKFRSKLFVCNDTLEEDKDAILHARLYNQALQIVAEKKSKVVVLPDEVSHCGYLEYPIPADSGLQVLFLCVDLLGGDGKVLSRSLYTPRVGEPVMRMPFLKEGPWISQVKEIPTNLEATWSSEWKQEEKSGWSSVLEIANVGDKPAYQVSIAAPDHASQLRYSDNFFWLDAGEKRLICIRSLEDPVNLKVWAWNAVEVELKATNE